MSDFYCRAFLDFFVGYECIYFAAFLFFAKTEISDFERSPQFHNNRSKVKFHPKPFANYYNVLGLLLGLQKPKDPQLSIPPHSNPFHDYF